MHINVNKLNQRNKERFHIPQFIRDILEEGKVFVAGGAIRAIFDGTKVSDYDIYCPQADQEFLANYFAGYTKRYLTGGVVFQFKIGIYTVQLIPYEDTINIRKVLDGFDFECCRMAYDGTKLITSKEALTSAKRKYIHEMDVDFNKNCFAIIRRILKYQRKGYTVGRYVWRDLAESIRRKDHSRFVAECDILERLSEDYLETETSMIDEYASIEANTVVTVAS